MRKIEDRLLKNERKIINKFILHIINELKVFITIGLSSENLDLIIEIQQKLIKLLKTLKLRRDI